MEKNKKLIRSRDDRIIAGVAGGLAKYLGTDPSLIRIIFVVGAFIEGITLLIYILMAIIVPEEEKEKIRNGQVSSVKEETKDHTINDTFPDDMTTSGNVTGKEHEMVHITPTDDDGSDTNDLEGNRTMEEKGPSYDRDMKKDKGVPGVWLGIGLILLGLVLLLDRLGLFWWLNWSTMWPIILVIVGIWMIIRRGR